MHATFEGIEVPKRKFPVKDVFGRSQMAAPLPINKPQPSELTRQHASDQIPY
jgi:hypothetical protein